MLQICWPPLCCYCSAASRVHLRVTPDAIASKKPTPGSGQRESLRPFLRVRVPAARSTSNRPPPPRSNCPHPALVVHRSLCFTPNRSPLRPRCPSLDPRKPDYQHTACAHPRTHPPATLGPTSTYAHALNQPRAHPPGYAPLRTPRVRLSDAAREQVRDHLCDLTASVPA